MTRLSGHFLGIWHKHGGTRTSDGLSLGGTSMVTLVPNDVTEYRCHLGFISAANYKDLWRPRYSEIVTQAIFTECSFKTDGPSMLNITYRNNPSPKRLNILSPFDSLRITHRYIREFDLSSNLHSTCCLTKHLRHLTGTGTTRKFLPERKGKGKRTKKKKKKKKRPCFA
jgi:hypothetical protein